MERQPPIGGDKRRRGLGLVCVTPTALGTTAAADGVPRETAGMPASLISRIWLDLADSSDRDLAHRIAFSQEAQTPVVCAIETHRKYALAN